MTEPPSGYPLLHSQLPREVRRALSSRCYRSRTKAQEDLPEVSNERFARHTPQSDPAKIAVWSLPNLMHDRSSLLKQVDGNPMLQICIFLAGSTKIAACCIISVVL